MAGVLFDFTNVGASVKPYDIVQFVDMRKDRDASKWQCFQEKAVGNGIGVDQADIVKIGISNSGVLGFDNVPDFPEERFQGAAPAQKDFESIRNTAAEPAEDIQQ
ncbi:MAG: hypothetical protein JW793_10035 [Acidobacteria bacterium]|nr:hypothetical protein [Acidobacteriota bacterium]